LAGAETGRKAAGATFRILDLFSFGIRQNAPGKRRAHRERR